MGDLASSAPLAVVFGVRYAEKLVIVDAVEASIEPGQPVQEFLSEGWSHGF